MTNYLVFTVVPFTGTRYREYKSNTRSKNMLVVSSSRSLVHIPLCYGMLVPMARAMLKHHVPMLVVWPSALAAVLLASFVIAYVLHVLIEKPSLRLRQALAG